MNAKIFFESIDKNDFYLVIVVDKNMSNRIQFLSFASILFEHIRSYDGIYYKNKYTDSVLYNKTYEIKYEYFVVNNKLKENLLKINNKVYNNIKQMESDIMAPYKVWSLTSLKDECKRRNMKESDYKDIVDKDILAELLITNDKKKSNKKDKLTKTDKKSKKDKVSKTKTKKQKGDGMAKSKKKTSGSKKAKAKKIKGKDFALMPSNELIKLCKQKESGIRPRKMGMVKDDMVLFLETGKKRFSNKDKAGKKSSKKDKKVQGKPVKKSAKKVDDDKVSAVKLPNKRITKLTKLYKTKYAKKKVNLNAKLKKAGMLNKSTKKLSDVDKFVVYKLGMKDKDKAQAYADSL